MVDQADNLALFCSQALEVGPVTSVLAEMEKVDFSDAFRRAITLEAQVRVYSNDSGATIRLIYSASSSEFVAFEARFSPPSDIGQSTLRSRSEQLAVSFRMPLANATYAESTSSQVVEGGNGSGPQIVTTTIAEWSEERQSVPLHFVNQLYLARDDSRNGIFVVGGYRWFADPPSLRHPLGQVVSTASDYVNESFGPRAIAKSRVGIFPNYDNLTWSILADLVYPITDGSETVVLVLDLENLSYQNLASRFSLIEDRPIGLVATAVPAGLLALSIGLVILVAIRFYRRPK